VTFSSLPSNYALVTSTRPNGTHVDKSYHGHPSSLIKSTSFFRSNVEFAHHLVSLLKNDLANCVCKCCDQAAWEAEKERAKQAASAPRQSDPPQTHATTPQQPPTIMDNNTGNATGTHTGNGTGMQYVHDQPSPNTGIDEDGTPNVFDSLIQQAKQGVIMDMPITEPESLEWILENEVARLPDYLTSLKENARWAPRLGEIVLIMRGLTDGQVIKFDAPSGVYKIEDPDLGTIALPMWEAAVVTQIPQDGKHFNVSPLGQPQDPGSAAFNEYRVEPMSEVGNPDKPWSTRYTNLRLDCIRPFQFWQELLCGLDYTNPRHVHPTVRYALAVMSSFSVVGRYHFRSDATAAKILCRGVYIGAEFIIPGDVVRFTAPREVPCESLDVLHVTNIFIATMLNREPEVYCLHIEGVPYTANPTRAHARHQTPVRTEDLPAADMSGYGNWYKMGHLALMPFKYVTGRLIEDEYVKTMFGTACLLDGTEDVVDFGFGATGASDARTYSRDVDPRIDRNDGQEWFFAEHRVEQLELTQVNGQDVGEKARYGSGTSAPKPLGEEHLKAMLRARLARGPIVGQKEEPKAVNQMFMTSTLKADRSHLAAAAENDLMEGVIANDDNMDHNYVAAFEAGFASGQDNVDFDTYIT
jgi:hypothetical protein